MKKTFVLLCLCICIILGVDCTAEDIVWKGVKYDVETVAKMVTVITATSPIKSNPNTEMLERAQASLYINPVFARCKKIIVFDEIWPQNAGSEAHVNYNQFKKNVEDLVKTNPYFSNTTLLMSPSWGHLSGSITAALQLVDTPYVFMQQHDLLLIKDFDLTGIVATMEANPNIKYVNLWPNKNRESVWYTRYVDQQIDGISFVPLCRSCGWTDQAHIASVKYYQDFVLPKCSYCFMEGYLNPALGSSIYDHGIDEGHKPFGTYLYGNLDDGYFIYHLDGRNY